jgi:hypothetical protein
MLLEEQCMNDNVKLFEGSEYKKKFLKVFVTVLPLLFIIISVIIPFVFFNNLQSYDHVGHLHYISYVKEHFFPSPLGWNFENFAGFPQGFFYAPLFYWLVAFLGHFFDIHLTYALIVGMSILMVPIALFFISKDILKSFYAASVASIFSLILFYFDFGLSSNAYTNMVFGMTPYLFSLMLFFVYLFLLNRIHLSNFYWILATFLLAGVALSHVITAVVTFLFGIIYLIVLATLKKRNIAHLVTHFCTSFVMVAWWYIPFIFHFSFTSGSNAQSPNVLVSIFAPFITLIALYALHRSYCKKNIFVLSLSLFVIILMGIYFVASHIVIRHFPLHGLRVLEYAFLLTPLLAVYNFKDIQIRWKVLSVLSLFLIFYFFSVFTITPLGPLENTPLAGVEKYVSGDERIIVTGTSEYIDGRHHAERSQLSSLYGMHSIQGLLTESVDHGWYIMSLTQSFSPQGDSFVWAYNDLIPVANVLWGSEILGVQYQLDMSDEPPEPVGSIVNHTTSGTSSTSTKANLSQFEKEVLVSNEEEVSAFKGDASPFYYKTLYRISDTRLAETITEPPVWIRTDWDESVRRWWTTDWLLNPKADTYSKPILIQGVPADDWKYTASTQSFDIIQDPHTQSFIVDASDLDQPHPIFLKMSYFPFWKAYDELGNQIEIHRASPNYMAINAYGVITFKFEYPWYYAVLAYVGLGVFFALMVKLICIRFPYCLTFLQKLFQRRAI